MLTLHRIGIENFVCFNHLVIEPSIASDRPLTVIRAENGSGKTTFLRAVRWGMYGEKGLPGTASRFSVHPAWWSPEETAIQTTVSIEFETDGSSRNFDATGSASSRYLLRRTVRTIGKPAARDNEPDFLRVEERATLMVQAIDGQWSTHEQSPDAVVAELLPWELRDFFIMDADEAADFVGGSENKPVSRQEYLAKTTGAINSLLGLEVFKKARDRIEDIARGFARKATKATGDHDLMALQEQLDQKRTRKQETEDAVQRSKDAEANLADSLEQLESGLEDDIGRLSAYDSWSDRLNKNRLEHTRAVSERLDFVADLAGDLESPDLLARMASVAITSTHNLLEPLHEQGRIPVAHLPFVRSLLKQGKCVCGQDLSEDSEHRRCVEQRVADADEEATLAGYLYHLYQATLSLSGLAEYPTWNDRRSRHSANLALCDKRIADLETEKRDLDIKLGDIDEERVQTARDEIAAYKKQLEKVRQDLTLLEADRRQLEQEIDPLVKEIAQRQRNERAAADHRHAEEMAQYAVELLNKAYSAIEQDQVNALSKRMNLLFQQMAANVSDADFAETNHNKANLRMINEVGVRPVEDRPGSFEIYALNSRQRAMPPVEINGASRRVLALSFVLALCDESNTRAPLVADSLLNFMSGSVRHNTLRVTSMYSRQPILLLTNSDLEAPAEMRVVKKRAGSTYTLTGQWDAIEAGTGGDVMRRSQPKLVALLCSCGPREYCDVCERTGQADADGWTKRRN